MNRVTRVLPLWAILGGLLVAGLGCRSTPAVSLQRFEFQSAHMGTLFAITLYAPNLTAAERGAEAAFARVNELEEMLSDYRADSELNLLRGRPVGEPVPVSADLFDVLAQARKISRISQGAFDVTVGPYSRLWRFSRKRKALPSDRELAEAREAVGWNKLRLDARRRSVTQLAPRMQLDVGGIAKGYAADEALRILRARGITRALVAASGDIAVGDAPPGQPGWKVGISGLGQAATNVTWTLRLKNAAVSTSGDTEQHVEIEGKRYSHIVDPSTGLGLTNCIQATVIAPRAIQSDPLATSVCILGLERGLEMIESVPGAAALVSTRRADEISVAKSSRMKKLLP